MKPGTHAVVFEPRILDTRASVVARCVICGARMVRSTPLHALLWASQHLYAGDELLAPLEGLVADLSGTGTPA